LSINLALILVILSFAAGVVIAFDKLWWNTAEQDSRIKPGKLAILVEYAQSFFPVLLLVLVIRSFVFEPFRIPSGSMKPTLVEGDFIFVKKFSYGLRLPVLETKIFETGSPKRGDVVVFRLPMDPSINYIKRVVGLPGDTVDFQRHRLTINGELIDLEVTGEVFERAPIYSEDLDGRVHDILIRRPGRSTGDKIYTVPEGFYFMMGDNRDNSSDSRVIGLVAEKFLVGEAVRVWMHWGNMPLLDRIGTKIQ
jgi:signal peptidase I